MTSAMVCRNCGSNLEAGRIDRSLGIVSCAHCGSLHELAPPARGRGAARDGAPRRGAGTTTGDEEEGGRRPRGPLAEPPHFDVRRAQGSLQVRWPKGRRAGAVVLFLIGLAWGAAAVSSGLIFLAPVALAILYAAVVRGVNRTTLRVDGSQLRVLQGPLPWPGARHLARGDIAQLFASERVRRVRTGPDSAPRFEERREYRLRSKGPDGRTRTLVGDLRRAEHALWLEREIEAVLGIEDAAVSGEYR